METQRGEQPVTRFDDPAQFFEAHKRFWLAREAAHSAFMRLVHAAPPGAVCLAVRDLSSGPPATASIFPGDQIIVSEASDEAITHLAEYLASHAIRVPGIFAPAPVGARLASRLAERDGSTFKTVKRLLHWELTELASERAPVTSADMRFRAATLADADTITAYRNAMQEEMNTQRPRDQRAAVLREIAAGDLHLLESPSPKAAASPGAIACIGTVDLHRSERSGGVDNIYTPPEFRGRGCAARLTRHLCALVLAERPVVFLSSDAAAPAPTRVYEKVGFKVVCEMENLRA